MRGCRGLRELAACVLLLSGVAWGQAPLSVAPGADPALQERLLAAVAADDVAEARAALQMGASPDGSPEGAPQPPLVVAAGSGSVPMVRLLLESGCHLQGPGSPGDTALALALMMSNKKVAKLLEKKFQDEGGTTTLPPFVIGTGHEEVVGLLLDAGIDANKTLEPMGAPPLLIALVGGNTATVKLLLSKGARADIKLKTGETPLLVAAMVGQEEIVRLFLPLLTEVDQQDPAGNTALLLAACQMDPEALKAVMYNFGSEDDNQMAEVLRGKGFGGTIRALLAAGADPNATNEIGASPLMAAAACGETESLKNLLAAGANVNLANEGGRTALMFAAQAGRLPAAELLLKSGADPKVVTPDGATALSLARKKGDRELVRLLETPDRDKTDSPGKEAPAPLAPAR